MIQSGEGRLTPLTEGLPALAGGHRACSLPGISMFEKAGAVVLAAAFALPSIVMPVGACEGWASFLDVAHFALMLGLFFGQYFVLVCERYGARAQGAAVGGGVVAMLVGTIVRVRLRAYGVRNWTPVIALATLPSLLVPVAMICSETEPQALKTLKARARQVRMGLRLRRASLKKLAGGSGGGSSSSSGEKAPLVNPVAPQQGAAPSSYGSAGGQPPSPSPPPPPPTRSMSMPQKKRATLLMKMRLRARSAAAAGSMKSAMQRRRLAKFGWTCASLLVTMGNYHFCISFSAWFVARADTPDLKTLGIIVFYVATAVLMAAALAASMKADRTRAFDGRNCSEFLGGRGDWVISNRVRLVFDLYVAVFTVHLFPLLSTWEDFAAIKVATLLGKLVMFPPRMSSRVRGWVGAVPLLRGMLGDTLAQDREKASFELFSTGIAEAVAFFSYVSYVALMRFALPDAAFPQFSRAGMSAEKYKALMVFLLASAVVDTATRIIVSRVLLQLTSVTTDQVVFKLCREDKRLRAAFVLSAAHVLTDLCLVFFIKRMDGECSSEPIHGY